MIHRCIGFALGWLLVYSCHGASVTLLWEPSPDSNVTGYVVYWGTVGAPTPMRQDVGNVTNAPVNDLQLNQTYFFYVTAYDSACNESAPSNVINYTVPPHRVSLSYSPVLSTNLLDWRLIWETNLWQTNLDGFYQLRIR